MTGQAVSEALRDETCSTRLKIACKDVGRPLIIIVRTTVVIVGIVIISGKTTAEILSSPSLTGCGRLVLVCPPLAPKDTTCRSACTTLRNAAGSRLATYTPEKHP